MVRHGSQVNRDVACCHDFVVQLSGAFNPTAKPLPSPTAMNTFRFSLCAPREDRRAVVTEHDFQEVRAGSQPTPSLTVQMGILFPVLWSPADQFPAGIPYSLDSLQGLGIPALKVSSNREGRAEVGWQGRHRANHMAWFLEWGPPWEQRMEGLHSFLPSLLQPGMFG